MISKSLNGISIYQFESFDPKIVGNAFFGRTGGVSPDPWSSLNQGGTVGDERAHVVENRRRAFAAIQRPVESIFDVWQVHSADIMVAQTPRPLEEAHQKADAIVTTNPAITLFMRFADCVPIMMYDPRKRVISIIHAGWQGTVKKIVDRTVKFLISEYQVDPKDLVAGIGPAIGPCHYQVGNEVVHAVQAGFPEAHQELLINKGGSVYLDLWKTNELQLKQNHVGSIEVAGICTACHVDTWYSHRAENGKTGRFSAAIYLQDGTR